MLFSEYQLQSLLKRKENLKSFQSHVSFHRINYYFFKMNYKSIYRILTLNDKMGFTILHHNIILLSERLHEIILITVIIWFILNVIFRFQRLLKLRLTIKYG